MVWFLVMEPRSSRMAAGGQKQETWGERRGSYSKWLLQLTAQLLSSTDWEEVTWHASLRHHSQHLLDSSEEVILTAKKHNFKLPPATEVLFSLYRRQVTLLDLEEVWQGFPRGCWYDSSHSGSSGGVRDDILPGRKEQHEECFGHRALTCS